MRHFLVSTLAVISTGLSSCASAQHSKASRLDQDRVCRVECGLSEIDIYMKNFSISQDTYLPSNLNPRNAMQGAEEREEIARRITEKSIPDYWNKNHNIEIFSVFYFYKTKNSVENNWFLEDSSPEKFNQVEFLSHNMRMRLLESMEKAGAIKIGTRVNEKINTVNFLDESFGQRKITETKDKQILKLTIPLFEKSNFTSDKVIHFRELNALKCDVPNTYLIKKLVAKNEVAEIFLGNASKSKNGSHGWFSSCATRKEWKVSMTPPKLISIGY